MNHQRIDALAAMNRAIAVCMLHTTPEGETPTADALAEAFGAVGELMAAASAYYHGYCVDEAEDTFDTSGRGFDTGCDREQHEAAKRLRDALARVGAP